MVKYKVYFPSLHLFFFLNSLFFSVFSRNILCSRSLTDTGVICVHVFTNYDDGIRLLHVYIFKSTIHVQTFGGWRSFYIRFENYVFCVAFWHDNNFITAVAHNSFDLHLFLPSKKKRRWNKGNQITKLFFFASIVLCFFFFLASICFVVLRIVSHAVQHEKQNMEYLFPKGAEH